MKWNPWDFQLELLDILEEYKEVVILKARQLGISWLMAGYCLWKSMFSDSAKVLLFSQEETSAWALLDKCRFMWRNLPEFLKITTRHDTRDKIDFVANDSEIGAYPSTGRAGRGTDATVIVRDELAKHDQAKEHFAAIGPAIDAGGQSIDLSTIDKNDPSNHFTERVQTLLEGARETALPSGMKLYLSDNKNSALVFIGWDLRPVREEGLSLDEWFETRVKPKYDKLTIEQEYPRTLEEALAPPITSCRFDVEALEAMRGEIIPPLEIRYNGLVKIFKKSVPGRKYCFAVDSSEGMIDPCAGIIVDWRTLEEVAELHGKIPLDEQARLIEELYKEYNDAYIAPERNASGLALIRTLKEMGVTKFYMYGNDKEGWWTSPRNRPVMIGDLAEAIRTRSIRMYSKTAINECRNFIRTEKHPDGVAAGKRHDDYVFAWAIALQIHKAMPVGDTKVTSFKYRES